ncbi:hypothetical protein EYF80_003310 [Liparis tanakae]|uniref:Uncharacterized protein n=1 Tax=Liparis tanakae TaxID=230148 RepID=A0A4Z2J8W0_9TELE|nr:hypothetical protein EYF80_003310 [Liparis tanakae]
MGLPALWWVCDDHEYSCPGPVCTTGLGRNLPVSNSSWDSCLNWPSVKEKPLLAAPLCITVVQ